MTIIFLKNVSVYEVFGVVVVGGEGGGAIINFKLFEKKPRKNKLQNRE